jgi:tetrahedral aminopeptidase
MTALLKRLSEAHGVSGQEDEVRAILLEEIRGRVDSCRVDGVGNLIARKAGRGGAPGSAALTVLLAAHMDEVGLMVTHVEDSGLLKFAKVGAIDDRILAARAVLVGKKRVPGVIGMKPVHLMEKGDRDQVVSWKQLSIDIGASSRAEAERLVARGDGVVFATDFRELSAPGGKTHRVQGKALDDRVGCTLLAELLKEAFPFDLVAAFTVQEEVGLRGARVAAYAERPDAAVVLECTGANEVPSKLDVSPSTRLGMGPAITTRDASFIADARLVELFSATAKEKGIPCQYKQPNIGGTDSGSIQRARGGVPSITIAVPARYIHSPAAFLDLGDFASTLELAREALRRLADTWSPRRDT